MIGNKKQKTLRSYETLTSSPGPHLPQLNFSVLLSSELWVVTKLVTTLYEYFFFNPTKTASTYPGRALHSP